MITLLIALVVFGAALALVPMDPTIRRWVLVLGGLFLFLWVLQIFGLISYPLRLR